MSIFVVEDWMILHTCDPESADYTPCSGCKRAAQEEERSDEVHQPQ